MPCAFENPREIGVFLSFSVSKMIVVFIMRDQEKVKAARRRWYRKNREKAKTAVRRRRKELYIWFYAYKQTLACQQCEEDEVACLDFHHRDPSKKKFNVIEMVRNGYSKKHIIEEIEKCNVLCCNCHRKFHARMRKQRL